MWKRVFSTEVAAGYSATGQDTSDSLSEPFQQARAAANTFSGMVGFGNFNRYDRFSFRVAASAALILRVVRAAEKPFENSCHLPQEA
jgi:hypothetical protein